MCAAFWHCKRNVESTINIGFFSPLSLHSLRCVCSMSKELFVINKGSYIPIWSWLRQQIGLSRVRALPLGVAAERSVHYFWDYFGPSRVRALPLGVAAERSVHYIWYYWSEQSAQPSVIACAAKRPSLRRMYRHRVSNFCMGS